MRYANPQFNLLAGVIVVTLLFVWWSLRRRRALAELFVSRALLKEMAPSLSAGRKVLKAMLVMAALWLMVFSLMRPQWGFTWEEVKRKGLDILIAMDVSKSMLARDVKPNRLERSKLAVKDMVGKLKGDRVGLIAFAGSAFLQAPLTLDYGGFLLALDDLDTTTIPRAGTAISSAIREAVKALKDKDQKFKVLVLITDGEDHEGDPLKAALEAQKEGVRIFCVGVGTKEGDLIPQMDEEGHRVFLKDREGKTVKSNLTEDVLQKIALSTGGAYVRATGAEFGLNLLYDQTISKLEKRELESQMRKQYFERYQLFLAAAVLLLVAEACIGERR